MYAHSLIDCHGQHVEQLLRSLNLTSPAPAGPAPRMMSDLSHSPTSPDLSPISTTSALLTPTDLSPAKTFDQKLPPGFEFTGPMRAGDNSLMFETGCRVQEGTHASMWAPSQSYSPDTGYFPSFEPFSEGPAIATSRSQPVFSSHVERRRLESTILPPTLPPLSWANQRLRTSSDWLKADDLGERGLQFNAAPPSDSAFRVPQASQMPSHRQGQPQTHEVRARTVTATGVLKVSS